MRVCVEINLGDAFGTVNIVISSTTGRTSRELCDWDVPTTYD